MAWDQKLPGCFGAQDLFFATHPSDEQRAFEWLSDLRARQIGWKEASKQIREFLGSNGAPSADIKRELAKARPKLKPWLGP